MKTILLLILIHKNLWCTFCPLLPTLRSTARKELTDKLLSIKYNYTKKLLSIYVFYSVTFVVELARVCTFYVKLRPSFSLRFIRCAYNVVAQQWFDNFLTLYIDVFIVVLFVPRFASSTFALIFARLSSCLLSSSSSTQVIGNHFCPGKGRLNDFCRLL